MAIVNQMRRLTRAYPLTNSCLLLVLALFSEHVASDERNERAASQALPLWEVNFATFARYGQAYPASEESQFNFVPLPFPIYRGPILRVGDETGKPVSTRIYRNERVKVDFDFGLNFSVDSDDVDARTGMPDLDLLGEAGPELEIKIADSFANGSVTLSLALRGAWSFDGLDPDSRGAIFSTELKYVRPLAEPDSEIRLRLSPEWANSDYMNFFYGVEPGFATASRSAFDAESGYLGARLSGSIKRQLSPTLQLRTGLSASFYNGAENKRSPLFTDKTTVSGFVALVWKFWESAEREPAGRSTLLSDVLAKR